MKKQFSEFFPYGCQYHRAPTPLPEEWAGDLAEIARCGYTHIQLRPQWRRHERLRGKPFWDDLDRLFDLAQKHSLRVILKPQLENAPDWVFTELGGTRIGFHGKPLDPIAHAAFYVGGWWPCFDNPAVAKAAENFTRLMAERYKSHPALWFYNAWNEPRSRPLGQCRCEHSINSYRNYLRGRFGTVEALNEAYGKEWTAFETVFPPHSHSDYVELFLWRQWAAEAVAEQVALSARGLKAADPDRPVMCHVGCSSLVQDPACDTSNDLLNAREVDFYGCSFPVELLPKSLTDRHMPLLQSAWLRRVDPDYWCQEFYTNYSNWHKEAEPEYIEQAIWMAIGCGCRGLTFWQYRSERFGEESNGWGMREIDGSPTRRSASCDRVAKALETLGADFARSNPAPAEVAICFSIENDLLMRIQAMECDLSEIESIRGRTDYSYKQAIAGSGLLMRKLGAPTDFVIAGDDLTNYKLLIITAMELITPACAEWLKQYVAGGGILLIEYPFACRDERTWVTPHRPSHGLEELTGCREKARLAIPAKEVEYLYFESDRELRQAAAGWRTTLEPCGGTVAARWEDGSPALVTHTYGKGRVFCCGGNPGMGACLTFDARTVPEVYRRALGAAGITLRDSLLWRCSRASPAFEYQFLFNVGEFAEIEAGDSEIAYSSPPCVQHGNIIGLPENSTVILRRPKGLLD